MKRQTRGVCANYPLATERLRPPPRSFLRREVIGVCANYPLATKRLRPPPRSFLREVIGGEDLGNPGHWNHSSEWYGSQGGGWGQDAGEVVFSAQSGCGNGTVSVTSHAFQPRAKDYSEIAARDADFATALGQEGALQWRVLRFNEETRQSVSLVRRGNPPRAIVTALAFDYIRTLAAALASLKALHRTSLSKLQRPVRLLFLGCGGGTLALFAHQFFSDFPGVHVICVDIDAVVLQAARETMGLTPSDSLHLIEADAAAYVRDLAAKTGPDREVDFVVFDVFDGENRTPADLLDPNGAFLRNLSTVLAPGHGTLLKNLHGEPDKKASEPTLFDPLASLGDPGFTPNRPRGREISNIIQTFQGALLSEPGSGTCFTLGVRRQRNVAVVVSRGLQLPQDLKRASEVLQKAADETSQQVYPWLDLGASAGYGLRRHPGL